MYYFRFLNCVFFFLFYVLTMNSYLIVLFVILQKEFPKYFTYRSVKQVGVKLLFSPKLVCHMLNFKYFLCISASLLLHVEYFPSFERYRVLLMYNWAIVCALA